MGGSEVIPCDRQLTEQTSTDPSEVEDAVTGLRLKRAMTEGAAWLAKRAGGMPDDGAHDCEFLKHRSSRSKMG